MYVYPWDKCKQEWESGVLNTNLWLWLWLWLWFWLREYPQVGSGWKVLYMWFAVTCMYFMLWFTGMYVYKYKRKVTLVKI